VGASPRPITVAADPAATVGHGSGLRKPGSTEHAGVAAHGERLAGYRSPPGA
jgi:hypothetical protein